MLLVAGWGGGHDEREQTLNQLLVEMDGFESNESVILIAATNRADILDPALLRPGRFDRQIVVDAPDVRGRERILQVHAKDKPIGSDVDLKRIAQLTPGFTGADLMNLMNESALLTARRGKKIITMREVNESMERVIAGPERKGRVMVICENPRHKQKHRLPRERPCPRGSPASACRPGAQDFDHLPWSRARLHPVHP